MAGSFSVRLAEPRDRGGVLLAVRRLIRELSANSDYELPSGAGDLCMSLIAGRSEGAVFVAEGPSETGLLGVMTLSLQEALRAGGAYAEIQEFWVAPEARSLGIGGGLVEAACDFCQSGGST